MPTNLATLFSIMHMWDLKLSLLSRFTPRYFEDSKHLIGRSLWNILRFVVCAVNLEGITIIANFSGFIWSLLVLNQFCSLFIFLLLSFSKTVSKRLLTRKQVSTAKRRGLQDTEFGMSFTSRLPKLFCSWPPLVLLGFSRPLFIL